MKTKNTSFMAGLLILGILSASDSTSAASIEKPISGVSAAKISRIIGITDIEEISINGIHEIGIGASGIEKIAIRNIINANILGDQIGAGITKIVA